MTQLGKLGNNGSPEHNQFWSNFEKALEKKKTFLLTKTEQPVHVLLTFFVFIDIFEQFLSAKRMNKKSSAIWVGHFGNQQKNRA